MSDPHIVTNPLSPVQKALKGDEEDSAKRVVDLERSAVNPDYSGPDKNQPGNRQHDYSTDPLAPKKNFDQKIYLFPESFNALRRELEENWRTFFTSVNPEFGYSPAWAMVHNGPQFVGFCNGALGTTVQFDSESVAKICHTFLNGFRALRGVSPISE